MWLQWTNTVTSQFPMISLSLYHCRRHTVTHTTKEWVHIFTMGALWLWGCMVWHEQTVKCMIKRERLGDRVLTDKWEWELLDVWVITLTLVSLRNSIEYGLSYYLRCEQTVRAGWEECSVHGYTPLSGIQISAHTRPIKHRKWYCCTVCSVCAWSHTF